MVKKDECLSLSKRKLSNFDIFSDYVKYTLKSDATLLIVKSRGGLGKTFSVLRALGGVEHVYVSGYITPLEFYDKLLNNQDGVIVLDDLEGLLGDKKNLAMLKSATFPSLDGKRVVQYSSSKSGDEKNAFVCNAKFIILCNVTPKGADWGAIQSRGLFFDFKPSNDEVFSQLLNNSNVDVDVIEFMRDILKHHIPVNFRMYQHIVGLKSVFVDSWKSLALPVLSVSDRHVFLRRLLDSGLSVDRQIDEYKTKGLSRSSYFRHKSEVLSE